MATSPVKKHIKSLPDNFIRCRELGHAWLKEMYTDERRQTGEVVRELECVSCTSLRIDRVGYSTGELYARRYKYAAGYLAPKGAFKRGELNRSEMRAEAMRRLINAR